MANINLDPPRGGREEAKAPDAKASVSGKSAEETEGAGAAKGAGFKAWLPLVVAVVAMPALAFATTHFILLPQFKRAMTQGVTAAPSAENAPEAAPAGKEGEKAGGKPKVTVAMNKMLVNVAGTMGTRYLMTSLTLVGNDADFKSKIDDNKDQLLDLATGTLSGKTISDLEKPGARNEIRAELLTVFNNALGKPLVQEIYITELAIQ
jgi:flagellar protein FliL